MTQECPPPPGSGSIVLHCNQAAAPADLLASWERSHYSQLDSKWPKLPVRGAGAGGCPPPLWRIPWHQHPSGGVLVFAQIILIFIFSAFVARYSWSL